MDSEAEQLCVAAKTKYRENERVFGPDFHIQLEKDIGQFTTGRAEWDFGELAVSREQLLSEYQNIASNYPDAWEHDQTEQRAAILKRMVAEDESQAKNAPTNLDALPVDQLVHELIFQLRDQNRGPWRNQDGIEIYTEDGIDIFKDRRGTNSPAAKLAAIGYPAVPQLIVALDDSAFSRSLGSWTVSNRSQMGSLRTVLTVGDYALAILERITGKTFYRPAPNHGYMSYDKKNGDVRKAVEAWWADFQNKGEKEMLIEGTEAGDDSSPAEGALLIERYPDAALQPLITGTKAETNNWTKKPLIELFDKIYSTNAESFLEEEMNAGDNAPYFTAARVLFNHGNSKVMPVMIHRWESGSNTAVIDFLTSVDSPQAIVALAKNLQSRPIAVRKEVVDAVGWNVYHATNLSAATLDAREELLVTALQDSGPEIVMSRPSNYQDHRVCDLAGVFLHQTWSNRYDFNLSASLLVRDRQRIECQNVWRQAHQLPLLAMPLQTNHVAESEAVKVTMIEWDPATVKPSDEFAARVDALKGKLLEATNCASLLADYALTPEAGSAGLQLTVRKDEDLSGVKLSFYILPGPTPRRYENCMVTEGAMLDGRGLLGTWSSESWSYYALNNGAWVDLTRAIAEAIAGPPKAPFVAYVSMLSR